MYNKTTWVNGDLITALKLNNIEDGIEELYTYVTPEMFGAAGDGVTDDTTALQSCFSDGSPVFIPKKTYITKSQIDSSITRIISDGGTIKFDGSYALRILNLTPASNFYMEGLTLDCNSKASGGVYVNGSGDIEVCRCEAHHTNNTADHIVNCYGIIAQTTGGEINIHDNYCHDIYRTVSNAGIIHSVGISTNSDGVANIYRNKVDNVRCDSNDANYLLDCDGISAYWDTANAVNHANILDNEISNCTTRAIKLQSCINKVKGNIISFAGDLYSGGKAIDVQYGEALVESNEITSTVAGLESIFQCNNAIDGHENITFRNNVVDVNDVVHLVFTAGNHYNRRVLIEGNDVEATNAIIPYRIGSGTVNTFIEVVIRNNFFGNCNQIAYFKSSQNLSDKMGIIITENTARSGTYRMIPVVSSTTPFNFSSICIKDNDGIGETITLSADTQPFVDFTKSRYLTGAFSTIVPSNMPADFPYARYFYIYQLFDNGENNSERMFAVGQQGNSAEQGSTGSIYITPNIPRS